MRLKGLAKNLLVTTALALTIVATSASYVRVEAAQDTYTVEKGDCLWYIAKKVYGNGDLWKSIYDANTEVIKSNYLIYRGQVLVIPAVNGTPAAADTIPAPTTPAPAEAPTTPAPAEAPTTPAPAETPTTASAPDQEFVLDYNVLASWMDGGFVGKNTAGETVIFATDKDDNYGIMLFADDSDKTAASFVGEITYQDEYMTITDETNGLALTCTVKEAGDGTLELDMGDLGVATVRVQDKENVFDSVRKVIEEYKHVA